MAETTDHSKTGKIPGKKPARKKTAIFMDMTPMVDLAFLLLTFFILVSSFSQHKRLEITMPDTNQKIAKPHERINEKDAITLYPQPDGMLLCKEGIHDVKAVNMENGDLKNLLLRNATNSKLWVFIKADDHSSYAQAVKIFDLLRDTKIENYSIGDRDKNDNALLAQF